MLISLITAWIAAVCVLLTAVKFFTKKNRTANRFFRRIHIPLGILLITAGLIHGLLAGNRLTASLSDAAIGQVLFSWNMGTICLILAILLGLTYVLRRHLKKKWIVFHRVLTVMLVAALGIHIFQMGITLPAALTSTISGSERVQTESAGSTATQTESAESTDTQTEPAEGSSTQANPTENSNADTQPTESSDAETDPSSSDSLVTFSGAELKDGTYEGSADGFKGTITVSVTVDGGAVTDIQIVSENDTPNFFSQAETIVDTILNDQSLEVDGVSGATYSSKGIQEAVYDALSGAVASGELKITEIQVSASGGHGHRGH